MQTTISHKIFETISSFRVRTLGKNSISVSQKRFTSTEKFFISGEKVSTRQKFYLVLRFS